MVPRKFCLDPRGLTVVSALLKLLGYISSLHTLLTLAYLGAVICFFGGSMNEAR